MGGEEAGLLFPVRAGANGIGGFSRRGAEETGAGGDAAPPGVRQMRCGEKGAEECRCGLRKHL